jgi:signal transduction histidine kinase
MAVILHSSGVFPHFPICWEDEVVMNNIKGHYTPTILQSAMGEPLRSEQRINEFFPRVLTRVDMLVIFIAIVLFIPNASVVQATQGAGAATYLYWVIGTITFLIPGAVVVGQLNRFMPVDGSIYVWTHRALGPLFGFFAGFCSWFPGILVLLSAAASILTLIQGIGVQISGINTNWLAPIWQQGILVIVILLFAGWLSTLPLKLIMKITKVVILFYGLGIFIVGLAGIVWLLSGHAPQPSLTTNTPGFGGENIVLYGVIVLALLGVEVPLHMAAEMKGRTTASLFLRWGPLLVLIAYLLGTFGVMAIEPSNVAASGYSTLSAVHTVFGTAASVLMGLIFISFFIIAAVVYNVTFARILFVSALDHRIPPTLARVNQHKAPNLVTHIQILIVLVLAVFTYFIGPLLYQVDTNFSTEVYDVSQATTAVIWCISMIILFLDLPILLMRFKKLLVKKSEELVAPAWVLYLCCVVGGLASLLGIWTTLRFSWNQEIISNSRWLLIVSICSIITLGVGLLGSAYPSLLSSLNEQTAAARENARLYQELTIAYEKLSQVDQLKDAFLTTASHELRTPLTIVQGYLELLNEMDDAPPDIRHSFLTKAIRACDELVLLQAHIMDASRIKFDAETLVCSSIPLREVCCSVIELFEPLILQQGRQVESAIAAGIHVRADETRLKQVLHNLIANALRYSPNKTPLRIAAQIEQEHEMACIQITDRGAGIPPEKQEAIFDKFVRLERDVHGINRGSGLGLYITRQLVEAMGGTITVESSGIVGEGSTFLFTLPTQRIVLSSNDAIHPDLNYERH